MLMQPAELIIIGGAAVGTVLIANPVYILKQMMGGLLGAFGSSKYTTQRYVDSLKMMYELLQKARKEGLVALETDIEEPDKSPLFSNYREFAKNHHALAFVCDTMRMAVSGGSKYSIWIRCWKRTWKSIITGPVSRWRRWRRWRTRCPAWALWRVCWGW